MLVPKSLSKLTQKVIARITGWEFIERLWQYIKEDFKRINFGSIEELQNARS